MRLSKILTGTIGVGIIAGGVCLTSHEEQKATGVKVIAENTSLRAQSIVTVRGDIASSESRGDGKTPMKYENPRDFISDLLEKDLILKQRIQGTSWYRDYILRRISREEAEIYFRDASSIEQSLSANPGMLEKIQYESWWQKYIRGDTDPTVILTGNIQAFLDIQKIRKEHPDLYEKAQQNPTWSQGIQQGEDSVVVGQREFLKSLQLRLHYLSEHPKVERRMGEKGFTRNNLFTDDWSKGEGIYGFFNAWQEGEETIE